MRNMPMTRLHRSSFHPCLALSSLQASFIKYIVRNPHMDRTAASLRHSMNRLLQSQAYSERCVTPRFTKSIPSIHDGAISLLVLAIHRTPSFNVAPIIWQPLYIVPKNYAICVVFFTEKIFQNSIDLSAFKAYYRGSS